VNAFYRDLSQAKIQQAMELFRQGVMLSAGGGAAYLDDVKIWTNVPTGLTNGAMSDLDHDGIADAVEIAQYGSTMLLPRGSVFKIR
jgi:hypothetical protein